MSHPVLRIDLISDIVCPWCAVGYAQLAEALKQTNIEPEIHWHPFLLNPHVPREGINWRENIERKYGSSKEESAAIRARMVQAGKEVGFEFNFTEDSRTYNTFEVHQLLHWAHQHALRHPLQQALFSAHFTQNRDLADHEVLADIAAEVGLDRSEALAVLQDQRFAQAVRQEMTQWQQQGIDSVPAFVFEQKYLVNGAQGVENFKNILTQLTDLANKEA